LSIYSSGLEYVFVPLTLWISGRGCFILSVGIKVMLVVLQYQRQLALQRIQEQEREMQIRQDKQKQQYLMGSSMPYNMQPPYMPG
jgi:hypothetical protein